MVTKVAEILGEISSADAADIARRVRSYSEELPTTETAVVEKAMHGHCARSCMDAVGNFLLRSVCFLAWKMFVRARLTISWRQFLFQVLRRITDTMNQFMVPMPVHYNEVCLCLSNYQEHGHPELKKSSAT